MGGHRWRNLSPNLLFPQQPFIIGPTPLPSGFNRASRTKHSPVEGRLGRRRCPALDRGAQAHWPAPPSWTGSAVSPALKEQGPQHPGADSSAAPWGGWDWTSRTGALPTDGISGERGTSTGRLWLPCSVDAARTAATIKIAPRRRRFTAAIQAKSSSAAASADCSGAGMNSSTKSRTAPPVVPAACRVRCGAARALESKLPW
jgi:hypothetical protein